MYLYGLHLMKLRYGSEVRPFKSKMLSLIKDHPHYHGMPNWFVEGVYERMENKSIDAIYWSMLCLILLEIDNFPRDQFHRFRFLTVRILENLVDEPVTLEKIEEGCEKLIDTLNGYWRWYHYIYPDETSRYITSTLEFIQECQKLMQI